jgi:hypothetical protein
MLKLVQKISLYQQRLMNQKKLLSPKRINKLDIILSIFLSPLYLNGTMGIFI